MNTDSKKERLLWVDSIKAIAVIWIFFTHYLVYSDKSLPLLSEVLYGVTGKYAVAFFAVFVGFFASKIPKSGDNVLKRIFNRYLQFSVPLLIVTSISFVIYRLINECTLSGFAVLKEICKESFIFQSGELCPQAWCIIDFFIASVTIYITAKLKYRVFIWTALSVIFGFIGYVWVSVCLFGAILYEICERLPKKEKNKNEKIMFGIVKLFLFVFAVVIIRFPESIITYLLDGISAAIIVFVCLKTPRIQKILSFKPLSKTGAFSFELFLVHVVIYVLTDYVLKKTPIAQLSENAYFWLSLLVSLILILGISYLFSKLLKSKPMNSIYLK